VNVYPTARAVGLAALGAPLAVAIALAAPHLWLLGPCWLVLSAALIGLDAALGASRRSVTLTLKAPAGLAAGAPGEATVEVAFAKGAGPARFELALEANARLGVEPAVELARGETGAARRGFRLNPLRRGEGLLERLWIRWPGPLGLVWKQKIDPLGHKLPITLNIQAVKDEAVRLFARNSPAGARMQRDLGGGSEFHALRDFQVGMDRRTIDWKQSARHGALLAKEFRAERNHNVVLVVDSGRLMCEPIDGLARIDHALNAALLLAYVSLKTGDRAGLFAFDARPNVDSGALAGPGAFALIQRLAAQVDYCAQETNYTLGLTELSARLRRRSLLVVFTEFADSTSAELMLETIGRLLKQHLVVFVVMRDEELTAMESQRPETPEDVSRAAVAAAMLQERDVVIERLERMGALIVETPASRIGPALINRYVDLKRRDLL
jgi:uncharacterized protein (DUF58 family)